jgi:hypothetical protein
LGHRQVQEDMGMMMLTESRRRTCGSSEAQRTWRAGRSRTAVKRVKRRGTRTEYATRERVWWFGPQNHRWRVYGFGLKTRVEVPRRNGWHVEASGSSRRGEATYEEARWPSNEDDTGLDHNALGLSGLTQLYPGAKLGLCNSSVK